MYADAVNMVARERMRVQRMVKILGKFDVVTRQGLMAELGLKREGIRNFRVKYWYPSRDAGYVMMVYAGAPTCPVQAYKLTEKGREYFQSKLDEIIDFSGCERYIDTPVKRYSSGMTVRLGFAVAAFLEPEILVVDAERCPDETGKAASAQKGESFSDAEFQKKAIGKMKDVKIRALGANWGPQRKAA